MTPEGTDLRISPLSAQLQGLEEVTISDPGAARKELLAVLEEARQSSDRFAECYALNLLAECACSQGNYDESDLFANYALPLSQRFMLPILEARALNILGKAASRQGKHAEALQYYMRALRTGHECGDDASISRVMNELAWTFSDLKHHEKALDMYRESAVLAERCRARHLLAEAMRGVIQELRELDRVGEALELLRPALQLATELNFRTAICNLRYNQALIYLEDRALGRALTVCDKGLKVAEAAGDYMNIARMHWLIGECHLNLAEYDEARRHLLKARRLAQAIRLREVELTTARSLSRIMEFQDEPTESLRYLREYLELRDDLDYVRHSQQAQFLTAQVQTELDRHSQEIERRARLELEATSSLLIQTQEELAFQAQHDPLTGAVNRSKFRRQASATLAQLQPGEYAGLLYMDLDGLRAVNEAYGYAAGDQLLLEVTSRMVELVRSTDLVGRLGGDEFMVLLTSLRSAEDILLVAQKFQEAVERPFLYGGHTIRVTLSIGCVVVPTDGKDVDTLHQNAEIALTYAKVGEQPIVRFHPSMSEQERLRRQLTEDLRQAAARGQLELYYQPQYAMQGRTLMGLEALIRWNHPELGQVPPIQFIPLAEETGFITELGEWVMQEACRQAAAWDLAARGCRVAVNVSVDQFEHPAFMDMVKAALEQHGLSGEALEIELTESIIHRNPDRSAELVRALMDLGVYVAMDDFGTGFSSLSMLKSLPLNTLKIDRTFLSDLAPDHPNFGVSRHFMEVMVNLAHTLDLIVVAEGIETEEHCQTLAELGCDRGQGYWLARPMPADKIAALLSDPRPPC